MADETNALVVAIDEERSKDNTAEGSGAAPDGAPAPPPGDDSTQLSAESGASLPEDAASAPKDLDEAEVSASPKAVDETSTDFVSDEPAAAGGMNSNDATTDEALDGREAAVTHGTKDDANAAAVATAAVGGDVEVAHAAAPPPLDVPENEQTQDVPNLPTEAEVVASTTTATDEKGDLGSAEVEAELSEPPSSVDETAAVAEGEEEGAPTAFLVEETVATGPADAENQMADPVDGPVDEPATASDVFEAFEENEATVAVDVEAALIVESAAVGPTDDEIEDPVDAPVDETAAASDEPEAIEKEKTVPEPSEDTDLDLPAEVETSGVNTPAIQDSLPTEEVEEEAETEVEEEAETPVATDENIDVELQIINDIEPAEASVPDIKGGEVTVPSLEAVEEPAAVEPIVTVPVSVAEDVPSTTPDEYGGADETVEVSDPVKEVDDDEVTGAVVSADPSATSAVEEANVEFVSAPEPEVGEKSSETGAAERDAEAPADVTNLDAQTEEPPPAEPLPVEEAAIASSVEEFLTPIVPVGEPVSDDIRSADSGAKTPEPDPKNVDGSVAKEPILPGSPKKLSIPAAFLGTQDAEAAKLSPKGGPSLSPVRKLAVPPAFVGSTETKDVSDLTPPDLGTPKKLAIPTAFGGDSGNSPVRGSSNNSDLTPPNLGTPKRLVIPSAFGGRESTSPVVSKSPVAKSPKSKAMAPTAYVAEGGTKGEEPTSAVDLVEKAPALEENEPFVGPPEANVAPLPALTHASPQEVNLSEDKKGLQEQDISEDAVAIETEYVPDLSPSRLQIPPAFAGNVEATNNQPVSQNEDTKSPRASPDGSPRKLVIPAAFTGTGGIADQGKPSHPMSPTKDRSAPEITAGGSPLKPSTPSKEEPHEVGPLTTKGSASPGTKQTKAQLLREIQRVEEEMASVQARTRAASGDIPSTDLFDAPVPESSSLPNSVEDGGVDQSSAVADAVDDAETFAGQSVATVNISLHSDPGAIPVVPHYSATLPVIQNRIETCLEAPEDEVEESSPIAQGQQLPKLAPPPLPLDEGMSKSPEKSPSNFLMEADAETATASETTPEKAAVASPSATSAKVDSPLPSPTNSEPVLSTCGSCVVL